MLTQYIRAAMSQATYKKLEEEGSYFGEIPGFDGLWANSDTLEACQQELEDALEEWIVLGLRLGHSLPVVNGIDLNFTEEDVA
ncbi:MAG: type II toxin-antitoxin system HicB family antitoxin [Elainellaceae cyanobacterium]